MMLKVSVLIEHLLKAFKERFLLEFVTFKTPNFDRKISIFPVNAYQFQISVIGLSSLYFLHTHKDVHETKHIHANTVTYLCCLTGGTNEPRRLLASEQSAALSFK